MSDELSFRIGLNLGEGNTAAQLSEVGRKLKTELEGLRAVASKVKLFEALQADAKAASAEFFAAKKRVDDLKAALAAVSDKGSFKSLSRDLKDAQKDLVAATRALEGKKTALKDVRADLTTAGVAVRNLASAEKQLAADITSANAALKNQVNKDLLGVKTLADIEPQLARLRQAYKELAASGTLSMSELRQAKINLAAQSRTLVGSTQSLSAGFGALRAELVATVAGVYVLQRALVAGGSAFADFSQRMAEVDSITNMSRSQLAGMSDQVRELAVRMGVDLNTAARALYDILGSGISEENAIAVLAKSARAAVAGVTDVNTAAKIGVAALNAYGLEASELDKVFDIFFKTVQDGVVTFPELAQNLGNVLPTARATGTTLTEVGAAMAILTKNGIKAPEAVTSLNQAMNDLATPTEEARVKMRDLDITYTGFIGTLQQIAEKQLTLDQLRAIIPDVRAAKGVLSLTQSIEGLNEQLAGMKGAAGATESAYNKLKDTPQAKIDRFKASVHDLSVAFGEFVMKSGGAIEALTRLLNSFNALDSRTKNAIFSLGALATVVGVGAVAIARFGPPLAAFAASLSGATAQASLLARALGVFGAAAGGFELGTWFYTQSESVRRFGDTLGITLGAVESMSAGLARLARETVTFNTAGMEQAAQSLLANIALIREEYIAVLSGAAERVNALTLKQQELAAAVSKTQQEMRTQAGALGSAMQEMAARVNSELTAVQTQISNLKGALGSLAEDLQALAQASIANGQATLAQIDAQTALALALIERRRKAMDDSRLSEAEAEKQLTQVYVTAAKERMAALDKAAKESLAALDKAETARLLLAKAAGENIARVEQDLAGKRKEVYAQIAGSYRQLVDQLIAEEQRHLAAAKTAADEKRQLNENIADVIRRLGQAEMSEADKRADDLREVDRLLFKAKEALREGDDKLARDYATKAVALAQQTAKEIKDGENVIVSARAASYDAIGRVKAAQDILNASLSKEEAAHTSAAKTIAAQRTEAEKYLQTFNTGLSELTRRAEKAIKIQIEADSSRFEKDLAVLRAALAQEAVLLPVQANIKAAQDALANITGAIEKGATLTIGTNLPAIKQNLDEIAKVFPALSGSISSATSTMGSLTASTSKLADLNTQLAQVGRDLADAQKRVNDLATTDTKSEHTVSDNVPAVLGEIEKLKKSTESTHTIRVKRVDEGAAGAGFAHGGLVPALFAHGGIVSRGHDARFVARAFASGGPVFRRALVGRVPGLGTGDTVPAMLSPGSFVLRQAAVHHYGPGLLSGMAKRLASGGPVDENFFNNYPGWDPRLLKNEPQSSASYDLKFGPPKLPDNEQDRNAAIYGFARQALSSHAGQQGQWKTFGESLATDVAAALAYISRTADTSAYMSKVLPPARTIALNLRSGPAIDADLVGYDIDGRRWRRGLPDANGVKTWEFYAQGGLARGADTVPAMLTPGEVVLAPDAVSHYGPGFLAALNERRVPKGALGAAVRYFSEGGLVTTSAMYRNLSSQISAHGNASAAANYRPPLASAIEATPVRTVRVELSAGDYAVSASIPASQEAELMRVLAQARARAI